MPGAKYGTHGDAGGKINVELTGSYLRLKS